MVVRQNADHLWNRIASGRAHEPQGPYGGGPQVTAVVLVGEHFR
jgi:hypothetical protein